MTIKNNRKERHGTEPRRSTLSTAKLAVPARSCSAEEVAISPRGEGISTPTAECGARKRRARTAFAPSLQRAFGASAPSAHDRSVEQVFGEKVYMHQYKINAKSAFTGDVWQWHQVTAPGA